MVSVVALASAMIASAGQIQIGGANGLTTSYIGSGNCGGNCTDQYNYDEVLFEGLAGTSPTPYTGYTTFGTPVGGTMKDSSAPALAADPVTGVTFAMINDGSDAVNCNRINAVIVGGNVCGSTNNYWALAGTGNLQTLTVPVNQYGVSQVWSMLNTNFAGASNAPADRSFFEILNFGTSGGTIQSSVTVKFTNTGDTSSPTGQIQNAILCTTIMNCNDVTTPNGGPLQTTNPTTLTSNGVSVPADADNLFSNSAGNDTLVLNDQGLLLGTLNLPGVGSNLNTYLVNVQFEETGNANYLGEYGAVSALTVVTASPEPSTVFMFLIGLGAIGFAHFRRSKA
jgi:hypothetical protein